ncbi:MAG: hypothetical protein AAFV53_33580 [Myxococcota bacterium]
MQPPRGLRVQETLDAFEVSFNVETDSDLREWLGIMLGLIGFFSLLVVLFLFLLFSVPVILDPDAMMMLFLAIASVIGMTFLLNFGPYLHELSADPCILRMTATRMQFTLGRWQTQCLLEDIQSAQAIDGRLEVIARDGSMRVLLEDGAPDVATWLADAIRRFSTRRQRALAAEGHDLDALAAPPRELLSLREQLSPPARSPMVPSLSK